VAETVHAASVDGYSVKYLRVLVTTKKILGGAIATAMQWLDGGENRAEMAKTRVST
jgi:hypothetical protein